MVGQEVERRPALALDVVSAGHEVGSHSMRHLDHHAASPTGAVADVVDGAEAIQGVLGFEPAFYRAPYGYFVPSTVAEAGRRRWTCVPWSIDGQDWEAAATAESVA